MNESVELASDILESFDITSPPVDPFFIAKEENIRLCPCKPLKGFYGRIEYIKSKDRFFLYHPDIKLHDYIPQVRFSLGHELGHYYIPKHRQFLLSGYFHYSVSNRLEIPLEQEADNFSATLLIPELFLRSFFKNQSSITIEKIKELANLCEVSITATAARLAKANIHDVVVILSSSINCKILRVWYAELPLGYWFTLKVGEFLPSFSQTNQAIKRGAYTLEGSSGSDTWFPEAQNSLDVYEETMKLGKMNLYLTLLTF